MPAGDVRLVKAVADTLRAGGGAASRMREAVAFVTSLRPARTGFELVSFLRAAPLVGEDLAFERDRTTRRPVDLG